MRDSAGRIALIRPTAMMVLYVILLLTFWINQEVLPGLRLTDLIIVGAALIWIMRGRLRVGVPGILVICFFVIFFVSLWLGLFFSSGIKIANVFFIYKYGVPVLLMAIFLSHKIYAYKIDVLIKLSIWVYLLLSLYVYVHIGISLYTSLNLYWRPAFPFGAVDPTQAGDAHLYSAYISNGLIFLLLCQHFGLVHIRLSVFIGLVAMCIGALVLTGSRNGVVSLAATLLLFGCIQISRSAAGNRRFIRLDYVLVGLIGTGLIVAAVVTLADELQLGKTIEALITRTTTISANDQSIAGRFAKLESAFQQVFAEGPVVFGVSMLAARVTWYDSVVAALVVVGGLFGPVLFTLAIIILVFNFGLVAKHNGRINEFVIVAMVVFNYALANLATEFFLVTRSVVPFIVNVALLANLIYTPRLAGNELSKLSRQNH